MKKLRKLLALTFIFTLSIQTLHGGSATWQLNPGSGDWNTANNWNPVTVPNAATDVATFAISNVNLAVSLSASTDVNGIVFTNDTFTITATSTFTLTLSGRASPIIQGDPTW